MPNTFINTSLVVRDASVILSDNLVMANLCNRNHEQKFAEKVGSTISVKVPPVQTARDFIDDGSVTDNNITETDVDLALSEQPYVAHTLTTSQKTLSLDDFAVVVTQPAVLAIRDAIDAFFGKQAVRGFAVYTAGTEGNNPSTLAHIAAARKLLQDNGCPMAERVAVVNTTAEASFIQLVNFISGDYGADRPTGLREATLTRLYGIDWFADQNMTDLVRGDVTEATTVKGAAESGTTLHADKGSGATVGTIREGSRFTINADTTVYTVMADATAASNEYTFTISPTLAATPADNAAITWKAALKGNVIYTKNALAGAVVPPAPLAVGSSSAYYNGVGIRVSLSSSTVTLSDQIVYDTYAGAIVTQRKGGCVMQG